MRMFFSLCIIGTVAVLVLFSAARLVYSAATEDTSSVHLIAKYIQSSK